MFRPHTLSSVVDTLFYISQIYLDYCFMKSPYINIHPYLLFSPHDSPCDSFSPILGSSFFFPKIVLSSFAARVYDWFILSFYLLKNVFIWRCSWVIIEQGTKSRLTVFPSPLHRCVSSLSSDLCCYPRRVYGHSDTFSFYVNLSLLLFLVGLVSPRCF